MVVWHGSHPWVMIAELILTWKSLVVCCLCILSWKSPSRLSTWKSLPAALKSTWDMILKLDNTKTMRSMRNNFLLHIQHNFAQGSEACRGFLGKSVYLSLFWHALYNSLDCMKTHPLGIFNFFLYICVYEYVCINSTFLSSE